MPGYPSLDPFEDMIGPVPLGGIRPRGNYGYAPYEEAAAMGQARLSTSQRLLAALSGLGAVRPGAGFGEAFLQGLGGSARNVYLAQTQAQNAAQEYAQRQVDMEMRRRHEDLYERQLNAQEAAASRPPKPEKPAAKTIDTMTPEEWRQHIQRQAELAKAKAAGRPQVSTGQKPAPRAVAAKPTTGAEKTSLSYYNRMKQAEETIATLEPKISRMGIAGEFQLRYAPNIAQSADQQVYRQAQRAFTEARLRKESGAAIPQGEYDTDAKTYFAQPGDKPETVKRKRAARQAVLNGLKFSAGRAYDEFYGAPSAESGRVLKWNPVTGEIE